MSIVEKAADKLRQNRDEASKTTQDPLAKAAKSAGPVETYAQVREQPKPPAGKPNHPVLKIDRAQLFRSGLYPSETMVKRLSDEFRRMKRPLLAAVHAQGNAAVSSHVNRIMITSAEEGEGKSFTAMNLALSLSLEHEHDVLLMDGDVLRHSLSSAFGLDNNTGLTELLSNPELTLDDVVVPTDVKGLSVLPAGARHELSSEMFSSRRMATLMNLMASLQGRIVVVDSPPILGAAETLSLATYLQQIVMVVRAGVTLEHKVKTALEMLESEQGKLISLVLNQNTSAHGNYYYYY